jgi:hypothetical protein
MPQAFLDDRGPRDGTFFVYGTAGPPNGHVVYDPAHHLAFYREGCCSWADAVAAADAPPKTVVARDLRTLSTMRGVRLWQTEARVMSIYGKSTPLPVTGHPELSLLAYTSSQRFDAYHQARCTQDENFFFRDDRLILIALLNAC